MSEKKRRYGLIGCPLSHSFSPSYFAEKFSKEKITDAEYQSYELEDLSDLFVLFEQGLSGLNVTIPYKEKVIPCLDLLDDISQSVGAVNTIKLENGKLIGFNTDVIGFSNSIKPYLKELPDTNCLILGSGGASKAVKYSLESLGYPCKIVSRSRGDLAYDQLDKFIIESHRIIVNTTPLGTYPNLHTYPELPYHFATSNHLFYDLTYNPQKTLFLAKAEKYGATIINGLSMLQLQAEASWKIWNA